MSVHSSVWVYDRDLKVTEKKAFFVGHFKCLSLNYIKEFINEGSSLFSGDVVKLLLPIETLLNLKVNCSLLKSS